MAGPRWLDRLEAELRRRKLPASYRARMLEELADHLCELEQENASMEAQTLLEERLGEPGELAEKARSEFEGRTFAGRHPVLTFGIAPVFAVLGTLVATLLLAWLVVWMAAMTYPQLQQQTIPPTALQLAVVESVSWFVRFTPFVLMAWWFSRVGRRIHRPRWGLLACAVVAALALGFRMSVIPATTDVRGQVVLGYGLALIPHLEQLLQAALPLAVGLWTWWSIARRERQATSLPGAA